MVNVLRERDSVMNALQMAMREGNIGLSHVPGLLKRVLKERAWERREVHQTHEVVRFASFLEFLQAELPEGLSTDLKLVKRFCADEPDVLDLLDQVTVGKRGAPVGNRNATKEETNHDNIMVCSETEQGTSRQCALRRLRKDRPDLLEQVLNKKLSAHAAMKRAGFVKEAAPLTTLQRAWAKASEKERGDFLAWVARANCAN